MTGTLPCSPSRVPFSARLGGFLSWEGSFFEGDRGGEVISWCDLAGRWSRGRFWHRYVLLDKGVWDCLVGWDFDVGENYLGSVVIVCKRVMAKFLTVFIEH